MYGAANTFKREGVCVFMAQAMHHHDESFVFYLVDHIANRGDGILQDRRDNLNIFSIPGFQFKQFWLGEGVHIRSLSPCRIPSDYAAVLALSISAPQAASFSSSRS